MRGLQVERDRVSGTVKWTAPALLPSPEGSGAAARYGGGAGGRWAAVALTAPISPSVFSDDHDDSDGSGNGGGGGGSFAALSAISLSLAESDPDGGPNGNPDGNSDGDAQTVASAESRRRTAALVSASGRLLDSRGAPFFSERGSGGAHRARQLPESDGGGNPRLGSADLLLGPRRRTAATVGAGGAALGAASHGVVAVGGGCGEAAAAARPRERVDLTARKKLAFLKKNLTALNFEP